MAAASPASTWERAWHGSLAARAAAWLAAAARRAAAPFARGSAVAAHSHWLAGAGVALLLFASPLVNNDQNALLVLLAAAAVGLHWAVSPPRGRVPAWLLAPVLAYFAAGLVATACSAFPRMAVEGFAKMAIYFLAYAAFAIALADRRVLRLALWALAASATIVAVYGIYQFIIKVPPLATWEDVKTLDKVTRVYSTLRNPNLLGGYLIVTIFFTLALFHLERGPWRWLAWPAAAAQALCLFYTYSRGAYIGGLAGAAAYVAGFAWIYRAELRATPWLRRALAIALLLGVLGTAVAIQASPALRNRITSIGQGRQDSSNNYRLNVWRATARIIGDNWAVGIGPGNDVFKRVYPLYMVSGFEALGAYNIFLEVWTELGLVGLLVFGWLWAAHLRACLPRGALGPDRALLLACLAGMVGTALFGMTDTVYYRPPVHILFWMALALVGVANGPLAAHNSGESPRT